jgi:hypothetical protein
MADEEVSHLVKAPKDLLTLDNIVKSCASAGFKPEWFQFSKMHQINTN